MLYAGGAWASRGAITPSVHASQRAAISLNRLQDGAVAPWSVVAGHSPRLGRDLSRASGSRKCAVKELAAEIASAILHVALGIVPPIQHADYIGA